MNSAETFWNQVGIYNDATFPVQMIMTVFEIILTYFVFAKPGNLTNHLMKGFLSFAFTWNCIVFFLIYTKDPKPSFIGAPLLIILAILFTADIFQRKTEFMFPDLK